MEAGGDSRLSLRNILLAIGATVLVGDAGSDALFKTGVITPPVTVTNPQMMDVESTERFLQMSKDILILRAQLDGVAADTADLHEWHNVMDDEGVRLMYGRTLNHTLEEILGQNREQTKLLQSLLRYERQAAISSDWQDKMSGPGPGKLKER